MCTTCQQRFISHLTASSGGRAAAPGLTWGPLLPLAAAALVTTAPFHLCLPAAADGFDDALELCPADRVTCVSSYDATPGRFVEPWEYDGSREKAARRVGEEVARLGGLVARDDSSARGIALRVRFPPADNAVFWFPSDDALVQFRSERTDGSLWDTSANKRRIDQLRKALGYAPAPMVRNRYYLPGERRADGTIQLQEERPYKRSDGAFYGTQSPDERAASGRGGLSSLGSPEALRELAFPFGRLGGRSSPVQALYDDLSDLASMRRTEGEKLYRQDRR